MGSDPGFSKDDPARGLGDRLRRIFIERGIDFFDKNRGQSLQQGILTNGKNRADMEDEALGNVKSHEEIQEQSDRAMTPEELFKMRMEILPQL
jgi:mediator of RNA polymerase II transcription subunit 17